MSRSQPLPKMTSNPTRRFIDANCGFDQGNFSHYRKFEKEENGKKGENVLVDLSTKGFALLDDNVFTITGYDKPGKFNIIANEVRANDPKTGTPLFDDPVSTLVVWKYPQGGQKLKWTTGTYTQIKELVTKQGAGSFTGCLYIMADDLVQDHLKLHGAAFSAWADFKKKHEAEIYQHWIKITKWEDKKTGGIPFKTPVFELGEKLSEAESEKAGELDLVTQKFLTDYMSRGSKETPTEENQEDTSGESAESVNRRETQKNWRNFKEEGKPVLGSLSIQDLIKLQASLDKEGGPAVESILYDCVAQATYDYHKILRDGSWKEKTNKEGLKFEDMTLAQLKDGLGKFNAHAPNHELKLYIEAAIEEREAEAGPEETKEAIDGKAEVVKGEQESPF